MRSITSGGRKDIDSVRIMGMGEVASCCGED